jgi:hypothetical protein
MRQRSIISILLSGMLIVGMNACTKDSSVSPSGNVSVKATAELGTLGSAKLKSTNNLSISNLAINISTIEFDYDHESENMDHMGTYSESNLMGPFELYLVKNGEVDTASLANTGLPFATYEEVKFKLEPGTDSSSILNGKSIYVEGKLDTIPFIFWTNSDIAYKLEFERGKADLNVDSSNMMVQFIFIADQVFTADQFDLTMLNDGNNDGIIEIYPNDPDGNEMIYKRLTMQLNYAFRMHHDCYSEMESEHHEGMENHSEGD